MCFFISCTLRHKLTFYFKGACNQFGFWLILKCKDKFLTIAMALSTLDLVLQVFKNGQKFYFLELSTRVCIACLKLAKSPKILLCLKFFSNCTQSKIKQQKQKKQKQTHQLRCYSEMYSATAVSTAIDFKTITIACSISFSSCGICCAFAVHTYLLRCFTL